MSGKIAVNTDKAPKALPGIYNQAIIANGMVFCSGAVALDKHTMKIIDGDVKAHTVSLNFFVYARKRIMLKRHLARDYQKLRSCVTVCRHNY
jgi:hypothetical protein